jgi:hypothetical protein
VTTEHAGRTFDWRPRFDERSLNFRAAAGVTTMPTTGVLWAHGPVLDQASEGSCVGMGCAGAVAAEPSSRSGVTFSYAVNWYRRAQRLDVWPGERYSGTSVLAGCLVGRERKLWAGFRWAKNPAELAAGLQNPDLGPAIIGVQWSEQLYETDELGVLRAGELNPDMGHCVLVVGYVPAPEHVADELWTDLEELELRDAVESLTEPSFLILNSWGRTFGRNGLAVAPLQLVRRWFAHHGEFGLPEKRAKRKGAAMPDLDEDETPESEEDPERHTTTLHLTAADVQEGDRILDPPEELGRESVTVRSLPRLVSGRRARITTTAGVFTVAAGSAVTVRRPQ